MKIKDSYTYGLAAPTSMGVRITPADRQPVSTSYLYTMASTSAESNVASIAGSLGFRVKLLTTFVQNSDISIFIKGELRKRILNLKDPRCLRKDPGDTATSSISLTADTGFVLPMFLTTVRGKLAGR